MSAGASSDAPDVTVEGVTLDAEPPAPAPKRRRSKRTQK